MNAFPDPRITAYLENRLSEAERAEFEQACRQQPALREQLQEEIRLRVAVGRAGSARQRRLYEQAAAALRRRRRLQWMAAAAVLLLLIASAAILLPRMQQQADMPTLYAQYFGDQPLQPSASMSLSDSLWSTALHLINEQQYARAIPLLEEALTQPDFPSLIQARLYLAQCHLKLGNTGAALAQLEGLPQDDPTYGYEVLWTRAMVYLRMQQKAETIALLRQLRESRQYGPRADALLKALESE